MKSEIEQKKIKCVVLFGSEGIQRKIGLFPSCSELGKGTVSTARENWSAAPLPSPSLYFTSNSYSVRKYI